MSRELFNDIFEVLEKDPDGKQFDKGSSLLTLHACTALMDYHFEQKITMYSHDLQGNNNCAYLAVSRFRCHSDLFGMGLMLDINTDIYPVKVLPDHHSAGKNPLYIQVGQ